MPPPEPQERVLHFLLKLPSTIRADVLVLVLLYATGEACHAETDAIDRLAKFLGEPPGPRLVSATLRILVAVDYVMARDPRGSQDTVFLRRLATFSPPALAGLAEHLLLGLPLRERHHRQALDEWSSLRAKNLTLQALREFEARCLAPAFDLAMGAQAPAGPAMSAQAPAGPDEHYRS